MEEFNSDYIVLSSTDSQKLIQWDVKTGGIYMEKEVKKEDTGLQHTDGNIKGAVYCSNGEVIAVLSDKCVHILDSNSGTELYKIETNYESLNEEDNLPIYIFASYIFACEQEPLIVVGIQKEYIEPNDNNPNLNSEIQVYNIETGERVDSRECSDPEIESVRISNNGRFIVVILPQGTEYFDLELDTEIEMQSVELDTEDKWVTSCNFSKDNKLLICGFHDGLIEVYNTSIKIEGNSLTLTVLYTFSEVFDRQVSDCRFLNSTLGSITKGKPDIGYSDIPTPDVILTCSTNGLIKLLRIDGEVIQNIDVQEKLEKNEKLKRTHHNVVEDGNIWVNRDIIVSKYEGYNSCDICIMCEDESMIVVSVHNHSMGDNSIICVFDLYGNLLRILEEFPEPSHILSLCSKPIDYGLKREKSSSILRSIAIDETSSVVETINAIIKNVKNNDNLEILENAKISLLDAQKKRSTTRSRPSTPVEIVFGDLHKREELVDYIVPKPKRPKHKGGTRLVWIHKSTE